MILIPLLLWSALLYGLAQIGLSQVAEVLFFAVIMAIAAKWLLADRIAQKRWALSFAAMTAFIFVWALLAVLLYLGTGVGADSFLLPGLLIVIFALATLLTRWTCRKRFSMGRFIAFNALAMIVSTFVVAASFAACVAISRDIDPAQFLLVIPMISVVYGTLLFLINLSFLLTALWSSAYRGRLERLLVVKDAAQLQY